MIPIARRGSAGRLLTAGAAGAAVFASFPPLGWWWAAPIGVAGLTLAVRGAGKRMAAAAGWVHGAVFLVLLFSFVRVFGIDAWLAVAGGEALFFAGLGLLLRVLVRLPWVPSAVGCGWVAEEAVRDRVPFGGLPWGRLADAQAGGPIAHLAALGGAPLVTFAVALAGGLLAAAATAGYRTARWSLPAWRGPAWLAGGLAVGAAGLLVPLPTSGTTAGGPASAQVALIQGNVPRLGLAAFAQRYAVTEDHALVTERLAALVGAGRLPKPQAALWPENSSDMDPYTDKTARQLVTQAVQAVGVPVLVGAVLNGPGKDVRNAAIVWSPRTGPGQVYVKQHLLPFGEYLPFRAELSKWIGRFKLLPRDFVPGHRSVALRIGPVLASDAICFEVADDSIVRDGVLAGGRVIIAQTNDASYEQPGDTGSGGESAQQLQISRLRAIEHGRSVLVVSTSGVSALVAPNGDVLDRTRVFTPAILDVRVALRDPLTIADRVGAWPEWVLVAIAVIGVGIATRQERSRRRRARGLNAPQASTASPSELPASASRG